MKRKTRKLKAFLILLTIVVLLITLVDISMRLVNANKQLSDLYIRQEQLNNKINRVDQNYATVFKQHEERLDSMEHNNVTEVSQEETNYTYDDSKQWDWNIDNSELWISTALAGLGAFLFKGKIPMLLK